MPPKGVDAAAALCWKGPANTQLKRIFGSVPATAANRHGSAATLMCALVNAGCSEPAGTTNAQAVGAAVASGITVATLGSTDDGLYVPAKCPVLSLSYSVADTQVVSAAKPSLLVSAGGDSSDITCLITSHDAIINAKYASIESLLAR